MNRVLEKQKNSGKQVLDMRKAVKTMTQNKDSLARSKEMLVNSRRRNASTDRSRNNSSAARSQVINPYINNIKQVNRGRN